MNNNYQNEITAIIQQAQRDIIYKAMDTILERNNQMLNLLEGGRGIFEQVTGDRFNRIHEQRKKIWLKIEENRKSIGTLWDIANTECVKC
jgi:hypothetical protein